MSIWRHTSRKTDKMIGPIKRPINPNVSRPPSTPKRIMRNGIWDVLPINMGLTKCSIPPETRMFHDAKTTAVMGCPVASR